MHAFRQALERHIPLRADAFVIGEPVSVVRFDCDGTRRRGLTATCQRRDGAEYIVAAADGELNPRIVGNAYLDAYRRWVGIGPSQPEARVRGRVEWKGGE